MPNFYGRLGIRFDTSIMDALDALPELFHETLEWIVMEAAEPIALHAYSLANVSPKPVGHGVHGEHMRDMIELTPYVYPDGVSVRIGIDLSIIPYAAHQEFGPRGKPFLRPAIDEGREQAHQTMKILLSEELPAIARNTRSKVRFRRYA